MRFHIVSKPPKYLQLAVSNFKGVLSVAKPLVSDSSTCQHAVNIITAVTPELKK